VISDGEDVIELGKVQVKSRAYAARLQLLGL